MPRHSESKPEGWQGDVEPTDVGDPQHHREWVAKYDLVLRALDHLKPPHIKTPMNRLR